MGDTRKILRNYQKFQTCNNVLVKIPTSEKSVTLKLINDIHYTDAVHAALTCDWVLAAMALLGHISLEAVHAVNVVLVGSEASFCQRFTAVVADKTLRVPGLFLVADPSRGDGLRGAEEYFDNDLKH